MRHEDERNEATDKPLVSIITIVYNNADYIKQTIESVYNQDYPNIEYIVIDGGSTDGTIEILENESDKISFWISEKDYGISDAFNKGLKKANGDLIGIINSDDWYEPNIISKIIKFGNIRKDLNKPMIVYGKTYRIRIQGERIEKKSSKLGWHVSVPFSHCSSFVSKEYYKKYGVFDENFKIAMDIDLLMRGIKDAYYEELPYFFANQRDGGISEKNRLLGYREYYHIAKKRIGIFKALLGYVYKLLIFYFKP
jgi:glycosyltransferase involved in cell wall biosynthesis